MAIYIHSTFVTGPTKPAMFTFVTILGKYHFENDYQPYLGVSHACLAQQYLTIY